MDFLIINISMAISYIYIIGGDVSPYKVGISKNPNQRLKNLQTGHAVKLKIHALKETDAVKTKMLETIIHHNIKHHRTNGEWFNLDLKTILLEVDYALIRYEDDPTLQMRVKQKFF